MSETEKPLHVRVAEALGCKPVDGECHCLTAEICPCDDVGGHFVGQHGHGVGFGVYSYDTDWSATGPKIEKYHFDVWYAGGLRPSERWSVRADSVKGSRSMTGETILVAACNLLVALCEYGSLVDGVLVEEDE